MASVKLSELQVNFDSNPRGEVNHIAVMDYSQAIREYESQGIDFSKAWEQPIEVTKDKIVVRGSHTVLALREVYEDDYDVEVKYIKIGDKYAEGHEDAKWLSAQSNKKGIEFGDGEVTKAIIFMLEQMQPTDKTTLENKRDFIAERPFAAAIGCSRTMINRVRNKWLKDNGYSEVVEDRKTGKQLSEDEVKESAEAAKDALKEAAAEQSSETIAKSKKSAAKKPKKDMGALEEDIDGLDELDLDEEEEKQHPLDKQYEKGLVTKVDAEEDEDLDDLDDENEDRAKHVKEFHEHMDTLVSEQVDMMLLGDVEFLISGSGDKSDLGVLRPLLKKYEPAEIEMVIDFLTNCITSASTECV